MPDEHKQSFGPGFIFGSAVGSMIGKSAMLAVIAATGGAAVPLLMVVSVVPVLVGALIGSATESSEKPKDK